MHAFLFAALRRLAFDLPYFVLLGVGIWICLRRRAIRPAAAHCFLFGLALFAGEALFQSISRAWLETRALAPPEALRHLMAIFGMATLLITVMNYAAWAIFLLGLHRALAPDARQTLR